jgi:hypothetical protein
VQDPIDAGIGFADEKGGLEQRRVRPGVEVLDPSKTDGSTMVLDTEDAAAKFVRLGGALNQVPDEFVIDAIDANKGADVDGFRFSLLGGGGGINDMVLLVDNNTGAFFGVKYQHGNGASYTDADKLDNPSLYREALNEVFAETLAEEFGYEPMPMRLTKSSRKHSWGLQKSKTAKGIALITELAQNRWGGRRKANEETLGHGTDPDTWDQNTGAVLADLRSYARMRLFDTVIGNVDRHGRNYMLKKREDGNYDVIPIDHSLAFMDADSDQQFFEPLYRDELIIYDFSLSRDESKWEEFVDIIGDLQEELRKIDPAFLVKKLKQSLDLLDSLFPNEELYERKDRYDVVLERYIGPVEWRIDGLLQKTPEELALMLSPHRQRSRPEKIKEIEDKWNKINRIKPPERLASKPRIKEMPEQEAPEAPEVDNSPETVNRLGSEVSNPAEADAVVIDRTPPDEVLVELLREGGSQTVGSRFNENWATYIEELPQKKFEETYTFPKTGVVVESLKKRYKNLAEFLTKFAQNSTFDTGLPVAKYNIPGSSVRTLPGVEVDVDEDGDARFTVKDGIGVLFAQAIAAYSSGAAYTGTRNNEEGIAAMIERFRGQRTSENLSPISPGSLLGVQETHESLYNFWRSYAAIMNDPSLLDVNYSTQNEHSISLAGILLNILSFAGKLDGTFVRTLAFEDVDIDSPEHPLHALTSVGQEIAMRPSSWAKFGQGGGTADDDDGLFTATGFGQLSNLGDVALFITDPEGLAIGDFTAMAENEALLKNGRYRVVSVEKVTATRKAWDLDVKDWVVGEHTHTKITLEQSKSEPFDTPEAKPKIADAPIPEKSFMRGIEGTESVIPVTIDPEEYVGLLDSKVKDLLSKYLPDVETPEYSLDELIDLMDAMGVLRDGNDFVNSNDSIVDFVLKYLNNSPLSTRIATLKEKIANDGISTATDGIAAVVEQYDSFVAKLKTKEGKEEIEKDVRRGFYDVLATVEDIMTEYPHMRGVLTVDLYHKNETRRAQAYATMNGNNIVTVYNPAFLSSMVGKLKMSKAARERHAGQVLGVNVEVQSERAQNSALTAMHEASHGLHFDAVLSQFGVQTGKDAPPLAEQLMPQDAPDDEDTMADTVFGSILASMFDWSPNVERYDMSKKDIDFINRSGAAFIANIVTGSVDDGSLEGDLAGIIGSRDDKPVGFYEVLRAATGEFDMATVNNLKAIDKQVNTNGKAAQFVEYITGMSAESLINDLKASITDDIGVDIENIGTYGISSEDALSALDGASTYARTDAMEAFAEARTLLYLINSMGGVNLFGNEEKVKNMQEVVDKILTGIVPDIKSRTMKPASARTKALYNKLRMLSLAINALSFGDDAFE